MEDIEEEDGTLPISRFMLLRSRWNFPLRIPTHVSLGCSDDSNSKEQYSQSWQGILYFEWGSGVVCIIYHEEMRLKFLLCDNLCNQNVIVIAMHDKLPWILMGTMEIDWTFVIYNISTIAMQFILQFVIYFLQLSYKLWKLIKKLKV